MGLFRIFPGSSTPQIKISSDGTPIAPDRTERVKCWEARDAFFACLDKIDVVDSIAEHSKAKKECGAQMKGFDNNCAMSWVTYFKQKRVMEFNRDKQYKKLKAEGATALPGQFGPGAPPVR